jgi:hypothetical protein
MSVPQNSAESRLALKEVAKLIDSAASGYRCAPQQTRFAIVRASI